MLSNFKSITGLEWGEITSILIALSVGLPFIYKVGFYNELGIGWYINTGNAFTIFVSSISVLFWGVAGLVLGYITFLQIIIIKNPKIRTFMPVIINGVLVILITITASYCFLSDSLIWLIKLNITGFMLTLVIFSIFISLISSNYEWKERGDNSQSYLASGTIILIMYAFLSWEYGLNEAKNVVEYREYILNKVNLGDSNENWYLVDYTSDKALILQEGTRRVFKIVEYKDIKKITPPEQNQINNRSN